MNKTYIYPHYVVLLKRIILFLIFFTVPVTVAIWYFCPEIYEFKALLTVGIGSALFVFYAALNYTHTMIIMEEGGLIVRKGWIPNTQDTIFWLHIKDVNSSAGALESIFGCGTIELKVTIRQDDQIIKLPFLPKYQEKFQFIREKISEQNKDARPMTYT